MRPYKYKKHSSDYFCGLPATANTLLSNLAGETIEAGEKITIIQKGKRGCFNVVSQSDITVRNVDCECIDLITKTSPSMNTLTKYESMIENISDERGNGDGIWVYLKKPWADFEFDPQNPTRQIHEQTIMGILRRLRHGVRKITDQDFYNFENLRY